MNILEHYIVEVHSEVDVEDGVVEVDFTDNCYGAKNRRQRRYPKQMWEDIKARGYYMG